jgi:LysM repeat protein
MTLASQNSRSDRPHAMRRASRLPFGTRGAVALTATLVAFAGAYALLRPESDPAADPLLPKSLDAARTSLSDAGLREIPSALVATPIAPAPVPATAPEAAPETTLQPEQEPAADAGAAIEPPAPAADPATAPPTQAQPPSVAPPAGGNGLDDPQALEALRRDTRPGAAPAAGDLALGLSLAATDPVRARAILSQALLAGTLPPAEAKQASDALARIAADLVFTPNFNAGDPHFFQYQVQSGDSLERIVRKHKLGCDWRLVARINNIKKPEAIRVGQRLKLPKGPFSAVVSKRDYRIDLCMGVGSDRVVMTSLPVGLGKSNGTPTGRFKVRVGSKLLNPEWRNPITGEFFDSNDPLNPIGEHWLGLEGLEASNAQLLGYGVHGTIEPGSIGQDQSLGCVRLIAEDVAIVWETLGDGCEVEIRP